MANSSHGIHNRDMEKYKEICDYRRRAFEFISQAIQCEETGENKDFALSLYKVKTSAGDNKFSFSVIYFDICKLVIFVHFENLAFGKFVHLDWHQRTGKRIKENRRRNWSRYKLSRK